MKIVLMSDLSARCNAQMGIYMRFYMAPMEGITGYLFRNVHHAVFPGVDRYYTPFISTCESGKYMPRDRRGFLPENNQGIPLVPQLLSNHADQFIRAAQDLAELGYEEVNLNLGCPSATVTSKGRGSGFLGKKEELERFLDEIFEKTNIPVSIKTRIGVVDPAEWEELLELYNRYPISELIVHPRVQKEFYQGHVHQDAFLLAVMESVNPLVYNGDIFTVRDYYQLPGESGIRAVMCGRGVLRNPGLIAELQGRDRMTKEQVREFHDRIYEGERQIQSGDTNVLHHMKELWFYLGQSFTEYDEYAKKLRKTRTCPDYEFAVKQLFREQELITVE